MEKANVRTRSLLCFVSLAPTSLTSSSSTAAGVDRRDACLWRIDSSLRDRGMDSHVQGEGPNPLLPQQGALRHIHIHVGAVTSGAPPYPHPARGSILTTLCHKHFALDAYRSVLAFIDNENVPMGALLLYSQLNHPTHIARTAIFITMTLIGDSFVVRSIQQFQCS